MSHDNSRNADRNTLERGFHKSLKNIDPECQPAKDVLIAGDRHKRSVADRTLGEDLEVPKWVFESWYLLSYALKTLAKSYALIFPLVVKGIRVGIFLRVKNTS